MFHSSTSRGSDEHQRAIVDVQRTAVQHHVRSHRAMRRLPMGCLSRGLPACCRAAGVVQQRRLRCAENEGVAGRQPYGVTVECSSRMHMSQRGAATARWGSPRRFSGHAYFGSCLLRTCFRHPTRPYTINPKPRHPGAPLMASALNINEPLSLLGYRGSNKGL